MTGRSSRAATLLAALAAAGCAPSFDAGDTTFSCAEGELCPSGTSCVGGLCLQQPDGDGGAEPDAPTQCEPTAHVVLSEVNLRPEVIEFIEVANPTGATVDLSDYYLSDDDEYWKTPSEADPPNLTSSDFIVGFPESTALEPGATLVIAFDPESFQAEYGFAADLALDDFEPVALGSPALNNSGESLVLFSWDGATDLVTDVDIIVWGELNDIDKLGVKTGESVDGPDMDPDASTYLDDADTLGAIDVGAPEDSLQRRLGEGGREASPGNGITDDDETSEPLAETWTSAPATPGELGFCIPE